MRALILLIPILIINGCKTQTGSITSSESNNTEQMRNKTACPEDGTCSVLVYQNSTIVVTDDETGFYPHIEKGNNMVVEFTYLKKGPEGTADGNYSETVHFEIPNGTKKFTKENASLSQVNLLFGKHGFYPGEAGYYEVTNGKLSVDNTANNLKFDLRFKVDNQSQVISHIVESVDVK